MCVSVRAREYVTERERKICWKRARESAALSVRASVRAREYVREKEKKIQVVMCSLYATSRFGKGY